MKNLIKIEEAAFFVWSVFLFSRLEYAWWWFPLLLFAPDVSMVGYFLNTRIGALVYNIVHHRAISILLIISGTVFGYPLLQLAGVILFAHSTLDRIFDYGLKYQDAFKHTHLGRPGNENNHTPLFK